MQEKAELRKKQRVRDNNRTPRALRPLLNTRKPRSIAHLKEAIKKHQTSDVDVIIPKRRGVHQLPPLTTTEVSDNEKSNTAAEVKHNAQTNSNDLMDYTRQNATLELLGKPSLTVTPHAQNLEVIKEDEEETTRIDNPTESDAQTKDKVVEDNQPVHDPILITEYHMKAPPKCDKDEPQLVEGKALKFYSQYLRGRLDKEYAKAGIDPEIIQCNEEAYHIEQKLYHFIDPNNNLPEETTTIKKLNRLDLERKQSLLPGGKCYVQKSPCKLLRRSLLTNNTEHRHTRHHMV